MRLIAVHLDRSLISDIISKDINTVCLFTGKPISEGVHRKHLISERFTDTEYLRYPSNYISIDVALCISKVIRSDKGYNCLRNYSYLATEKELRILQREEILPILLAPPDPPFCLAVTFSNKKHTSFKTIPAYDRNRYVLTTDKGNVFIDVQKVKSVLNTVGKWYTVIPGKEDNSLQPTYFTKEEILFGSRNFKRIQDYGEDQYVIENGIIEKYRKTLFLTLIVHLLNKKIC